MKEYYPDDAPEDFSLFRRRILIGGGLLIGGFATVSTMHTAAAGMSPTHESHVFMELSSLLIAHQLNPDVGARLAAAFAKNEPAFAARVTELLAIAKSKNANVVEDFFPAVPQGVLKETALSIISAWYLGVIVNEPGSEVFAYELALMYQPSIDVMTIPSYAIAGPNGWNSTAPPLGDMPKF